jgi:hypothetical protein
LAVEIGKIESGRKRAASPEMTKSRLPPRQSRRWPAPQPTHRTRLVSLDG